jgi:hypothetical protein
VAALVAHCGHRLATPKRKPPAGGQGFDFVWDSQQRPCKGIFESQQHMNSYLPPKIQVQVLPLTFKAEELTASNFAERWLRRKFPGLPPNSVRTYAALAGIGQESGR